VSEYDAGGAMLCTVAKHINGGTSFGQPEVISFCFCFALKLSQTCIN